MKFSFKFVVFVIFLISLFALKVDARVLCDCFGICISLDERDISQTTKYFVKKRAGYAGQTWIEVDHKIPLCLGGSNNVDNLQALTKAVHSRKTAYDMLLLNEVKTCQTTVQQAYEKAKNYKAR